MQIVVSTPPPPTPNLINVALYVSSQNTLAGRVARRLQSHLGLLRCPHSLQFRFSSLAIQAYTTTGQPERSARLIGEQEGLRGGGGGEGRRTDLDNGLQLRAEVGNMERFLVDDVWRRVSGFVLAVPLQRICLRAGRKGDVSERE